MSDDSAVRSNIRRRTEDVAAELKFDTTIEYGVFNDEFAWDPLFASGEVAAEVRELVLERPLYETEVLREAVQHARLTNEDRAARGDVDKFGFVVVRTRSVARTAWIEVSRDEQSRALGEF